MYIDVHCHIDGETYGDVDRLISLCRGDGVERIITVGFDLNSSLAAREYAEKYDGVYFTAGLHPTELKGFNKDHLKTIEELLSHPKCVAVGEIGLDYHYPDTDKPLQREVFLAQLEIAARLDMPVQIHSRDCAEDMLGLLTDNAPLLKGGALMHCYSHSTELAESFLKLGCYFSFGGASTWKGSKKAKRTIALLPKERILTETDSPYMPPQSAYGTFPNTPRAIPEICASIADIKGVSTEEMQRVILSNAHTLFKKLS